MSIWGVLSQALDLGGSQTRAALAMALQLDQLKRARLLDERAGEAHALQMMLGQQRLDDMARRSRWEAEDRPFDIARQALRLQEDETQFQWAQEDRARSLASRQAAQQGYAREAARLGLFRHIDPTTGAESDDVMAYQTFAEMDPKLQAERLDAHRRMLEIEARNQNAIRLQELRNEARFRRDAERLAYIEGPFRQRWGDEAADRALEQFKLDVSPEQYEQLISGQPGRRGSVMSPEEHAYRSAGVRVKETRAALSDVQRRLKLAQDRADPLKNRDRASRAQARQEAQTLSTEVNRLAGELAVLQRQEAAAEQAWLNARAAGTPAPGRTQTRAPTAAERALEMEPGHEDLPGYPAADPADFEPDDEYIEAAMDQLGDDAPDEAILELARRLQMEAKGGHP